MMGCQNLAVPAEVMQHVVNVESSRNPYAIGVVGGQLVRQPQNLPEAVATVQMLEQKGYNYSLGVAQVNRSNLGKYGLDSYEKAFDVCPNLRAGSRILAQCYASANKDWGKAFSCYYSGNFTTGYRDGYVQRIYESIAKSSLAGATAIPLQRATATPVRVVSVGKGVTGVTTDSPAYRVAMRSVLDAAASAFVSPAMASEATPQATSPQDLPNVPGGVPGNMPYGYGNGYGNPVLDQGPPPPPGRIPTDPATAAMMRQVGPRLPQGNGNPQPGRIVTDPGTAAVMSQIGVSANPNGSSPAQQDNGVFEPQVRGPNDPPQAAPMQAVPMQGQPMQGQPMQAPMAPQMPARDPADTRNGGGDGAFVF